MCSSIQMRTKSFFMPEQLHVLKPKTMKSKNKQ